jgi:hypothetical protein
MKGEVLPRSRAVLTSPDMQCEGFVGAGCQGYSWQRVRDRPVAYPCIIPGDRLSMSIQQLNPRITVEKALGSDILDPIIES